MVKILLPCTSPDGVHFLKIKDGQRWALMAQIPAQHMSLLWPMLDLSLSKSQLEKGELGGCAQPCVCGISSPCAMYMSSTGSGKDAGCPHSCCSLICRLQLGNQEGGPSACAQAPPLEGSYTKRKCIASVGRGSSHGANAAVHNPCCPPHCKPFVYSLFQRVALTLGADQSHSASWDFDFLHCPEVPGDCLGMYRKVMVPWICRVPGTHQGSVCREAWAGGAVGVWQSRMGGAWGKLRYELQQSGGNRTQVRARGFMEIVQGLIMVEDGVGMKRSTLMGIQSPAAM